MLPEPLEPEVYFETPERAERLQLLLHLVRNAGEVIYLRGPAGAGKTLFARRLLDILGNESATIWIRADVDSDFAAVAADQLGLDPAICRQWPDDVLAAVDHQDLLVVVDDADQLDLEAMDGLLRVHARGGHLLLIGNGGLARARGDWDVQFVDLPAFNFQQSATFLRSRAAAEGTHITDDMAAALHGATHGQPGPLLEGLDGILARARWRAGAQRRPALEEHPARPALWPWLAGGAVALLLGTVLVLQDRINALFEGEATAVDDPATAPQPPHITALGPGQPTVAPPPVALPAARPNGIGDVATGLDQQTAETAVASLIPPMPRLDEASDPVQPPPVDAGAEPDPLETVMRDALAAPEVETVPDAGGAAGSAADGPSVEASPAGVDEPAVAAPDPLETVMRDALAAAEARRAQAPVPTTRAPSLTVPTPAPVVEGPAPRVVAAAPSTAADSEARGRPEMAAPVSPAGESGPPIVPRPDRRPAVVEERRPAEPPADAAPGPRVVETPGGRAATVATARPTADPAPVVQAAGTEATATDGLAWLKSRQPARYTLQLVGARDLLAVEKFARDKGVEPPYAVFARPLKGKPWYSLVAGDYPDRAAAVAARDRLQSGLAPAKVWPRTFESIQNQL